MRVRQAECPTSAMIPAAGCLARGPEMHLVAIDTACEGIRPLCGANRQDMPSSPLAELEGCVADTLLGRFHQVHGRLAVVALFPCPRRVAYITREREPVNSSKWCFFWIVCSDPYYAMQMLQTHAQSCSDILSIQSSRPRSQTPPKPTHSQGRAATYCIAFIAAHTLMSTSRH